MKESLEDTLSGIMNSDPDGLYYALLYGLYLDDINLDSDHEMLTFAGSSIWIARRDGKAFTLTLGHQEIVDMYYAYQVSLMAHNEGIA